MQHPGWALIVLGGLIVVIGVIWLVLPAIPWLGKLPGDIAIERENFGFYFPIATCVVLSLLLTGILWVVRHLLREQPREPASRAERIAFPPDKVDKLFEARQTRALAVSAGADWLARSVDGSRHAHNDPRKSHYVKSPGPGKQSLSVAARPQSGRLVSVGRRSDSEGT